MKNIKQLTIAAMALIGIAACSTKPAADNTIKTTITVNGERDTVINDPGKGDGNIAVSESCIKCLIGTIHGTENYKMLITSIPPQNMIYYISWITSKNPIDVGNDSKIVNGIAIDVKLRDGGSPKNLNTFLYNNEDAQFYMVNDQKKYEFNLKVDSDSLKKIRNCCFRGVASHK